MNTDAILSAFDEMAAAVSTALQKQSTNLSEQKSYENQLIEQKLANDALKRELKKAKEGQSANIAYMDKIATLAREGDSERCFAVESASVGS